MARSNNRQQLFIEEYFACGLNATRAAIAAGYSPKTARSQGQRLLTNVDITKEVKRRIDERAMPAEEVLDRLGQMARGDMSDFWDISPSGKPTLNMAADRVKDRLNLIKKLKVKTTTRYIGEIKIDETEIDFELYDAKDALSLLGKHHGLFKDVTEIEHKWIVEIGDLLKQGRVTQKEVEEELGQDLASRLFESIGLSASTSREAQA